MKRILNFYSFLLLVISVFFIPHAEAYTCRVNNTGVTIPSGRTFPADVSVTLSPQIQPGQTFIVDLSQYIDCWNNFLVPGTGADDLVAFTSGTTYGNILANFSGTLMFSGQSYSIPLNTTTPYLHYPAGSNFGLPVQLYLTAITGKPVNGVAVSQGEKIATFIMRQSATDAGGAYNTFSWNIYAANSVVIPVGGCDVSSTSVTVNLPNYPANDTAVPLTVHCGTSQPLSYYLTGTTTGASNNIFTNTASSQAAQNIGIQLSNSSGVISPNTNVSLGSVGMTPVSLGLTANYAVTGGGLVTAGNVQSVIGVTFLYQ